MTKIIFKTLGLKIIISIAIISFVVPNLFPLQTYFSIPVAQAAAGVPKIISYQGRLTDATGALLGGAGTNYTFKFSIWDNPTPPGGLQVWPTVLGTPTAVTLNVVQGVFNVNIGAAGYPDALNYDFNTNDTVYLQVEVLNPTTLLYETLAPRQQITSAGYAINASTVAGKTPGNGANNILALDGSGNITAAGAITISSGGATAIALDAGGAAGINIGTVNANAITVSKSGITTTIQGAAAFNEAVTVGNGAGNDYLGFTAEATNPACAAGNYRVWANSVSQTIKKCENGCDH